MTSDWDQRQLCPDGSCVGVIGPDGTCKVCGHAAPNWGDERNRGLLPVDDADDEDDDDDDDDADDAADDEAADEQDESGEYEDGEDDGDYDGDEDDDADDDEADKADDAKAAAPAPPAAKAGSWKKRQLCSDGGCIGVIGDDGRCKVCGRSAKP